MAVPELAETRAATGAGAAPRAARSLTDGARGAALAVVLLTAVGLVIRGVVAHESLFADELSTYWIVATHGLRGVLSLLYGTASIKHAEITPPLYFVASWLTVQLGHTPELLRLPSLLAGTLSIPMIYVLGVRTVGRRRAILAAAITTVSPFMVYYSTEARAYGVMMLLVMGSTLAMLLAIDTGRRGWWVGYAVCACLAFWTHYTCLFVLGALLLWALWVHPEARRPALLASVGAAVGALPWLPGLIDELNSPTVRILSDLSPFNVHAVGSILGHLTIGYPYSALAGLTQVPGRPALVLLGAAVLLTAAGIGYRWLAERPGSPTIRRDDRLLLLVALLLVTPVVEALISAVSTHIFGLRNLAASFPALVLVFSAIVLAAGSRAGIAAGAMVVLGLALGAERMVVGSYQRPDYQAAASFVDGAARPGDIILDQTGDLSPGPLTGLDVALGRPLRIVRALAPEERDHPFTLRDPYVSVPVATRRAIAEAGVGARIFVVGGNPDARTLAANAAAVANTGETAASSYRRVAIHRYFDVAVSVYSKPPG
jgi:Dolichyl-phosphate-mannose-protein mannosyltransferase